jgi:hypothetical protein
MGPAAGTFPERNQLFAGTVNNGGTTPIKLTQKHPEDDFNLVGILIHRPFLHALIKKRTLANRS